MSPIPPAGLCCEGSEPTAPTFGIGARVQYDGTTRSTLDADGTIQPMLTTPAELAAVIANPYTYDLWIEGAVDLGTWLVATGAYTGRFATFARKSDGPSATIALPYASTTSGRDGTAPDATPTNDFPVNAGVVEFGFLLPAGASETVSVGIGLSIADDGTLDTYTIAVQQQPAITYSGVPVP